MAHRIFRKLYKTTIYLALMCMIACCFVAWKHYRTKYEHMEASVVVAALKSDDNGALQGDDEDTVTIVTNNKQGLWDKPGTPKITVECELDLNDSANEHYFFHRVYGVEPDSGYNIYVTQYNTGTVQIYNKYGQYLRSFGRKGQGPGEFVEKVRISIDADTIYIMDPVNRKFTVYTTSGRFIRSSPFLMTGDRLWGFDTDQNGNFYASYYKRDDTVLHKYNRSGELLTSFGKPQPFRSNDDIQLYLLKRNWSRGWICIKDSLLYYAQCNPMEIHIFSLDGILRKKILKKDDFTSVQTVTNKPNSYTSRLPISSNGIIVTDSLIINCINNNEPPDKNSKWQTILDIYNLAGVLLTSIALPERLQFFSADEKGRLYGQKQHTEIPTSIVRYRLSITAVPVDR